jgi:hypothetical protein
VYNRKDKNPRLPHFLIFNRGRKIEVYMIRYKYKIYEDFFIDPETAIITDKNGVVQETHIKNGRPCFHSMQIHRIQVHTHLDYKKGLIIHHLDHNKMNNSLANLVYLTTSEHMGIHKKGRNFSEETKKKMSEAHKGRTLSEETKEKLSKAMQGKLKGTHLSDETKEKLSKAMQGKKLSEDVKRKIAKASKGRKHSEETKLKLSKAMQGKLKGTHLSEETKKKISESLKGNKLSEETKKKISESLKGKKKNKG